MPASISLHVTGAAMGCLRLARGEYVPTAVVPRPFRGRRRDPDTDRRLCGGLRPRFGFFEQMWLPVLEVLEDGQNKQRINIVKRRLARALVQLAMSKGEQEPKAVSIGRHGMD